MRDEEYGMKYYSGEKRLFSKKKVMRRIPSFFYIKYHTKNRQ